MLLKTLNKDNGNICFVGNIDGRYDFVFEYAIDGTGSYTVSPGLIKSLLYNSNKYLVSLIDSNEIYDFSGGIFTLLCSAPFSDVSQIENADEIDEYYILSTKDNILARCEFSPSYSTIYGVSLPDYANRESGKIIIMRNANNTNNRIIYHNNYNAYLLEDNGSSFVAIRGISIGNGTPVISAFLPRNLDLPVYARIRQFDGMELSSSSSES